MIWLLWALAIFATFAVVLVVVASRYSLALLTAENWAGKSLRMRWAPWCWREQGHLRGQVHLRDRGWLR